MPSEPAASSFQTGFLARPLGRVGVVLFLVYFITLSTLAVEFLLSVWPRQDGAGDPVNVLWGVLQISLGTNADLRLALVAVASGFLGAFVHSATSFVTYLGNRQLVRSWTAWYVLRPLIGMGLALMFYFLIRAGFIAPGTDGAGVNPFGVAGIAALAGMFSKESVDKLREVFEHLIKPPKEAEEERKDKLTDPLPDEEAEDGGTTK